MLIGPNNSYVVIRKIIEKMGTTKKIKEEIFEAFLLVGLFLGKTGKESAGPGYQTQGLLTVSLSVFTSDTAGEVFFRFPSTGMGFCCMKVHLLLALSTGASSCWDGFIWLTLEVWDFGFSFGSIDPKGLLGLLKIRQECQKVIS